MRNIESLGDVLTKTNLWIIVRSGKMSEVCRKCVGSVSEVCRKWSNVIIPTGRKIFIFWLKIPSLIGVNAYLNSKVCGLYFAQCLTSSMKS